jgi:hypothetical protein
MLVGKGRSINQYLIESSIKVFEDMLSDIPKYIKEQEASMEKSFKEDAIKGANGDKAIEDNIYKSLSSAFDDYNCDGMCNYFYEALLLSIYSFYERMLKKITPDKKLKKQPSKSYAINLIEAIKNYYGEFEIKTEEFITNIDNDYRTKRNTIAHEDYDGFVQIEPSYIEKSLKQIKAILLDINSSIELKNKQKNEEN